MKFDPRYVLLAALAAIVISIPGGATATPPATFSCPDGFILLPLGAAVPEKDHNGNEWVCVKESSMHLVYKDDTCNPNCDQNKLRDNLLALPEGDLLDDALL